MGEMPFVSVIIPVFNDNDRLGNCLRALEQQDYDGEFEIIVCDNGSSILPQVSGRSRLVTESKSGSYAARNRGIEVSRGDILAFTDSDCVPDAGWLRNGVAALLADERTGLVGGRIRIFTGGAAPTFVEMFEMAVAFPQELYITNGNYAATANMFTKRSVMDAVGPFSSHLRSGGDADWGRRVAAAGYRLRYTGDAMVGHPARSTQAEIIGKLRRTVGGERDSRPGWNDALRFIGRHMLPPRHRIRLVLATKELGLFRRCQVALYCVFLNWTTAAYRLYLQITKAPSSRT